jgi:outer membrane protein assembly factor BamB
LLACYDLNTGKQVWRQERIRLKGKGDEPGFFEAFALGDLVVVHGLNNVLAFDVRTGEPRWHFRAPFDFKIDHAILNGDLLVLAGETETLALYVPTKSPVGEVVWQVKEQGDLYIPPYFDGDRLVNVRKMPFNVTVRYRATGKLIGRLELPDLSLHEEHPLIEDGPPSLPVAHDGSTLVVTDGWYYVAIDTDRLRTIWKRLIDQNDTSQMPAMRFTLEGKWLLVLKEDYDQKTIWMLDSRTGEVRWHTDPKANLPRPLYASMIHGDTVYGLMSHPGQGYYWAGLDCKTGEQRFQHAVEGYNSVPSVRLVPRMFGSCLVTEVQDRQDFELNVLDIETGERVGKQRKKGTGMFGVHGRVSATVQDGRVVFLTGNQFDF